VRRHPWLVVSLLAVVGVLLLGAFPARAYLDQINQREQLAERAGVLRASNEALAEQASRLQTDEAIERLARERYQLVRPGEEAYAILPDGASALEGEVPVEGEVTSVSPPAASRQGFWSRAWTRMTSIF
jgi:cell division protein FtsB